MRGTKERDKRQNGVTLIALVITIIMLFMLAEVSIALLTGKNGLITQAEQAKSNTSIASAREKIQVEAAGSFTAEKTFDKEIFKENLKNNLKIKENEIEEDSNEIITIYFEKYEIYVDGKTGKLIEDPGIKITDPVTTGDVEDKKIELTWEELKQVANAIAKENIDRKTTAVTATIGEKSETLRVGNYKVIKYDGKDKKVRILGFNSDIKKDDKKADKKAGITFEFVTDLGNEVMNDKATNVGGWNDSKMKKETLPAMLSKMTLEDGTTGLNTIIETVKKEYNVGDQKTENSKDLSEDKLWLLSASEIFSKNSDERYAVSATQEGEQYKFYELITNGIAYNASNAKLGKYSSYNAETNESTGSTWWWWFRSPCYANNTGFGGVLAGSLAQGNYAANSGGGVTPGFCI